MTTSRIKKGLFAILLVVAGYIWWGNIQSFRNAPVDEFSIPEVAPRHQPTKIVTSQIPYQSPKVNPFRRYGIATNMNSGIKPAPPPQAELLHIAHRLKGIVGKGSTAQAVVQLPDQTSKILSLNDLLGVWRVKEIRDVYITFVNGKRHDTLFLDTKGL